MNSNWWTQNQQKFIRSLLLKIKNKNEWFDYYLNFNDQYVQPFHGNNVIYGGLTFDLADELIKCLLCHKYKLLKTLLNL